MTLRCLLLIVLTGCPGSVPPPAQAALPLAGSQAPAQLPSLVADPTRTTRPPLGSEMLALQIDSSILGEIRPIGIALPRSFVHSAATRRYPVAIVLDGEADLPAVAAVCAELSLRGQVPEMIVVGVENTDRLRDLTPPGLSVSGSSTHEGGDLFLDFLERELLPAVDGDFRGAEPRTLIGHSSGGILATYAAATRATWKAVVALDTPVHLGANWLAVKLTAAATAATRPPLRYVACEARFTWSDDAWNTLVSAAPASWTLHHERLSRESHESMVMLGAYLGLREAFADYSMLSAPEAPTTSILPYYQRVGDSLGASVVPPRPLLAQVMDDLLMEGRGAAAREAYDLLATGYGPPPDADEQLARIADVEARPAPTETVESLLATPFPTPEAAAAYLGDWIGDVWMNEDELYEGRPRHHLSLRVVDGRVQGDVTNEPAPGETMVQPITYLKLTPSGMTYGYMNGMRPRGMVLFEGELRDGTLSGAMRFGGIDFRFEDGSTPPPIRFAFTKRT